MKATPTALLLLTIAARLVWPQETPGCSLRDASSPDRSALFLLCGNGVVLSRNGSGPWSTFRIPSAAGLRAIRFLDSQRGFAAGDSGSLWRTTDGAQTWNAIDAGENEILTAIQASGNQVWVSGYRGLILHSADGGRTWRRQRTLTTETIESLCFLDEKRGWAVGWSGLIIRTVDGGNTWQQTPVPGIWETLSSVAFRDPQNGWAAGMYGLLLRTQDGGNTWERQQTPVKSWLGPIVFPPEGGGWIVAEYSLLHSEDAGESWQVVPLDTPVAVTRLLAMRDSVLAMGADFLMFRSGANDVWTVSEVDQVLRDQVVRNSL